MTSRSHDRSHFFKYTSYETAKLVIENKSFRWSSPVHFNDPFDHQTGFAVHIDGEQFARLLTESLERVVYSNIRVQTGHSDLAALSLHLRAIRHKLPREQFRKDMYEDSLESAKNIHRHMDDLSAAVNKQLCHSRVFCVSEVGDNVVMWSHYGEQHRGVVFQLGCVEELDHPLLIARPVSYADAFVPFLTAEEYAMHLTGERPIDMAELIWKIAYTKHADWSYEREWRLHRPLVDQPAGDGYSIVSEDDRVFEAVYLGCRMPEEHVAEMTALVRRHLPDTRIFCGRKDTRSFSLVFEEV